MKATMSDAELTGMRAELKGLSPVEGIQRVAQWAGRGVVCSTAFGLEGQLITHYIATHQLPVELFTIDTGRLFPETYDTWFRTLNRYAIKIQTYVPEHTGLQMMLEVDGPNSFYQSPENRLNCCFLRKVEPLQRALTGKRVWISGLRGGQSKDRAQRSQWEYDAKMHIYKYYPLFNWSEEEVIQKIKEYRVPYNPLYDQGFKSIGCAPCTRSLTLGEEARDGRWWWESSKKECGLHS
ncbi:phosphoadenylyl-sulfate reductase [bacterium SCSIO 12741]|nr:phosphoadenylyl-sulfate reductase [bacterium SCSIO 12741]